MDHPGTEHVSSTEMVDYMLSNPAEVVQFADFGPRLALNSPSEESFLLKSFQATPLSTSPSIANSLSKATVNLDKEGVIEGGGPGPGPGPGPSGNAKGRRKRPRTAKTSEEVESQRMTHIAVERNRRRQMNEYLRVLRSLMPGSYVQRGDQASIIGGAIEFVRELEQLIQCLESQKRRRLMESNSPSMLPMQHPQSQPQPLTPQQIPLYPPFAPVDLDPSCTGVSLVQEETAENKTCIADIEVKLVGFDAFIKILTRRRSGQLIRMVAALEEELQFAIMHTNITTIDQTVLYSFTVKNMTETRCTAEEIANSVHQMLSFIDANTL
ncbi:basic helix-loop-helix (bHLH) DNA-binding superfamily protein [Rhynchospora pubera]|uniref:Basic helix-loop-helix (BHLH) DNA-binding superfamily protein n=1 Tax=Rhynchospora pubera TaxID=906938 RepID=A0AAV8HAI8_9POAL|nr:basic helix-loop-helix (bHLH) DNA-binding superfamily protein [Rhynchospora pubera]